MIDGGVAAGIVWRGIENDRRMFRDARNDGRALTRTKTDNNYSESESKEENTGKSSPYLRKFGSRYLGYLPTTAMLHDADPAD
jgi:hypothetical protein